MTRASPISAMLLLAVAPELHAEHTDWLALSGVYIGDVSSSLRGGERTGTAASHLARAELHWNARVVDGVARQSSRASVMVMDGPGVGPLTGDLQGLNNIDAPSGLRLYELWTETNFGEGMSLRGGFLDLNTEFDVPATSALFVSPPHGIGTEFAMSGSNGPAIWPVTGLGLRLQGERQQLQWRVAAFEGEPGTPDDVQFARVRLTRDEGALVAAQMSWSPAGTNKLQLGAWFYTARFEAIDPADAVTGRGNRGAYALVDVPVASIGSTKIDAALRIGAAASRFNAVDRYVGAVVTASGFETMPNGVIGLGVAHASTTPGWRAAEVLAGNSPQGSETAIELTWRHFLSESLALLPHVHFVMNPGALRGPKDAWVIGLRLDASAAHIFSTKAD
jgi:porin